jgi:hypothetical protein
VSREYGEVFSSFQRMLGAFENEGFVKGVIEWMEETVASK